MSATVVSPAPEPTLSPQPPPVPPRVEPAPVTVDVSARAAGGDAEVVAFGKAILLGIVLGIPILGAAVVVALKALAPSLDTPAVIGVAVWVALFCGPFLAGTVTVGLSSHSRH